MTRRRFAGLCLTFSLACAFAAPGVRADELWDRAVAIVAANDSWNPGTIALAGRELDGKGRTRSSWDVLIRSRPGPDGQPVQDVVRYMENGADVTEQRQRAPQGRGAKRSGSGESGNGPFSWNPSDPRQTPFHPEMQGRTSARRLEGDVVRDGRSCVSYAFEQSLGEKDRAVGTAWLDADTGAPVGMEATFLPLPPFVARALVEVRFATEPNGALVVAHFRLEGEATILLLHRTYAMEMDLSDHWKSGIEAASR